MCLYHISNAKEQGVLMSYSLLVGCSLVGKGRSSKGQVGSLDPTQFPKIPIIVRLVNLIH